MAKTKGENRPYHEICNKFREVFIAGFDKEIESGAIEVSDYGRLREDISKRRWNVRNSLMPDKSYILLILTAHKGRSPPQLV